MSKRYTIMFVCTGNTCRSPMAEGALRSLLEKERPGKALVISSGTHAATGYPATQYAQEAVRIWDIDISDHASQILTPELLNQADLILAMSPEHLKKVLRMNSGVASKAHLFKNFPENDRQGEAVEDPIGSSLDRYNETFLEIGEFLGKFLPEIVKRIDEISDGS